MVQVKQHYLKQAMFPRPGLTIDTARIAHLSHPFSDSSMSTSPIAASTASVVTSSTLGLSSPSEPSQDTSAAIVSVPSHSSVHSASYDINAGRPSSIVSAAEVENHSLHSSAQQHLVPMYSNTANSLFGTNNSTPSTLVMTPPSSYGSEMSPSIMGSDSGLMPHASSWYPMHRPQHHSYPEMIASEWSNSMCGNSGFAPSNASSLSACAYQMSLPSAYPSPISSVYHHPSSCRPSPASTIDYLEPRFNTSYHPYYNNLFNSGSPTGASHSLTPLTVGTEMNLNQMPFSTTSTLLNSSPDSGLTASSEGNESPSLAPHSESITMLSVPSSLSSASLINIGRSHAQSAGGDLEEDIKPNLSSLGPVNGSQEATSTTSNSSNGGSNGSTHLNMYNWMKKSTNSSSSQSSTGKTRTKDKYRVVYTETQRVELEKEFHFSRYITIKRKSELAHQLMLSERQVKIWFQNRRAKDRKQQRKRDEMMKKEKKENPATVVVSSSHSTLLPSSASTPGVLVQVSGSGSSSTMGNSCNNLLVTSVSGSTIHHHTAQGPNGPHAVGGHHFGQAPHHSLHSPGAIIQPGYRDMLSAGLGSIAPAAPSEMAH